MNKRLYIGLVVAVLVAGGIYMTTTAKKEQTTQNTETKTVNFGAVLAFSGFAAHDGENIKDGIELAKQDLLKENIVLNVEYFDDATDPKKTIAGVEFMNSKGIKTIFGPTWSFQISAALPTIHKYGMTAYIADSSSDVVEGDPIQKEHIVHGVSPIYQIIDPSTQWMKDNKVTKLGIITVDGSWDIAHTEAWKKSATNAGITVGLAEKSTYANEGAVVATYVIKAKAAGIDGIVWTGTDAGAIALIKKMQELDYKVPVLATRQMMAVSNAKKVDIGDINVSMIESARSEAFDEKYRAVYNREPSKYAESSYDLTMIAVRAELEKDSITAREYVISRPHEGFSKEYRFDKMGDITNLEWFVTKI